MPDNEKIPAQSDALIMIVLRQVFYLQQLRLALGALLVLLVLISILASMLVYFLKHPVHPIYFATNKLGQLMVEPPLNQPFQIEQVNKWVTTAIEAAYSYDFINYRQELQNAQKYFTDYGWRQYMKGLQASNNLLALTQRRLIVGAAVQGIPKLLVQGILGNQYAWKFEIPVLLTYLTPPYDEKSQFSNPLIITVIVKRQKLSESDHGLGVVQMIANLTLGG